MRLKFFQKNARGVVTQVIGPKRFRQSLLFFFGSSCAAALLSLILYVFIFRKTANAAVQSNQFNYYLLYFLIPTLFTLGILILLTRPSMKWMQCLDHLIVLTVLGTLTLIALKTSGSKPLALFYGVLILWHAATVPTPVGTQLGFAMVAFLFFSAGEFFLPQVNSSSFAFWEGFISAAFPLFLLLAISVVITRSLYHSQKHLFEAQSLGNYQILRELGTGGMGKVYEASHAFLCRPTAIKIMEDTKEAGRESAMARFEKEVKLSATLTHPNSVTIFDYGCSDDNTLFYAMELLEGLDLQRLIERFGPMSAARTLFILNQICGALNEAHEKGIVHRDIKPSNIFLACQGGIYDFVKVLDYGLAKEMNDNEDHGLTQTGELIGTPRYIAPESVTDKANIDRRTDIYLLGAVAYWMTTGKAPFEADTSVEVIVEHLTHLPKKPSEVSEIEIPEALENIILKCLEKRQEDRFQNITEVLVALQKVPLQNSWSSEAAREWWNLHFPVKKELLPETIQPPAVPLRTLARAKRI